MINMAPVLIPSLPSVICVFAVMLWHKTYWEEVRDTSLLQVVCIILTAFLLGNSNAFFLPSQACHHSDSPIQLLLSALQLWSLPLIRLTTWLIQPIMAALHVSNPWLYMSLQGTLKKPHFSPFMNTLTMTLQLQHLLQQEAVVNYWMLFQPFNI